MRVTIDVHDEDSLPGVSRLVPMVDDREIGVAPQLFRYQFESQAPFNAELGVLLLIPNESPWAALLG